MPIKVIIDCSGKIVSKNGMSEKTGVTVDDICDNSLEYYKYSLPVGEICIKKILDCPVAPRCSTCTYNIYGIKPIIKKLTYRQIYSIGIRQPSNVRTSRIASLNTYDCNSACKPQNNLSDRTTSSISVSRVKRNSSSTRHTKTANRPGAMTPGGIGVDQKHGSYERYLNAKKGRIIIEGLNKN
jgi:hypothetical protein